MIGEAYRSIAAQAVLGPSRSQLVPAVLHLGWLDNTGALIAMSGATVSHDAFGPVEHGVSNIVTLDAGVAGDGWDIAAVALFDAASSGQLVASADLAEPVSPPEGSALTIPAGSLSFIVAP